MLSVPSLPMKFKLMTTKVTERERKREEVRVVVTVKERNERGRNSLDFFRSEV